MKCIEFLGLPGSGKSTLAQNTVTILRAQRQNILTRLDVRNIAMRSVIQRESGLLWRFIKLLTYFWEYRTLNLVWEKNRCSLMLRFMSEHPQLTHQIIECAELVDPPLWLPQEVLSGKNLMEWFFDVASYYQASHEVLGTDDVLLLEEGFCQHSYYLLAFQKGGFNEQKLEAYLQVIPKPDLLISLLLSPEECEERMKARVKGISSDILRPLTASQRLAILEQRLDTYKKITDYLAKENVTVIRLDYDDYSTTQKILKEQLVHF